LPFASCKFVWPRKTQKGATYKAIAEHFNLTQVGSVCYPLTTIKKEIVDGGWMKEIKKEYCIEKYA